MENTYPNEELVEIEQPRINHISKSSNLLTKIKNKKPLQLAMELNSEHVVDLTSPLLYNLTHFRQPDILLQQ